MSEETGTTEETSTEEETTETGTEETTEQDEWTPPTREAWDKLQQKAERREKLLRERQEELAKLKGKPEETEPSEADKLRAGMVRTAGRAVLAGLGVTDREDQSAILEAVRLDGIEVDETGEVDTDELETRIARLRKALSVPEQKQRPRVDTRDKGGRNAKPADRDSARYRQFMGHN